VLFSGFNKQVTVTSMFCEDQRARWSASPSHNLLPEIERNFGSLIGNGNAIVAANVSYN